jgi:serine/threonine-protein kinase
MREEPDQDERWRVADALWAIGRRSEADTLLAKATSKFASSRAYWFARSYALRNDKDEAFKWLYRANDNREPFVTLMKADPLLRNLRGDPRFTALLRKLKLPT